MAGMDSWPRDWRQLNPPISHPFTITPADADLADFARAVECTEECTLKVTTIDGTVFTRIFYRGFNPVPVARVWSTGSTVGSATLIGWY